MKSNNKRMHLSAKFPTKNKFVIYFKYNFFNGFKSGLTILVLFAIALIGILSLLSYVATKINYDQDTNETYLTTDTVMMIIGALMLICAIASMKTTLNDNISKKVNRIFLFGEIKRNQIKNFTLVYNGILLVAQAIMTIILVSIIFGLSTVISSVKVIELVNLEFFATLVLKVLSAYFLGLLLSVLIQALPKKGAIKLIVIIAFFFIQYLLASANFALIPLLIIDNFYRSIIGWILFMIPSVSSGSSFWWNANNWLIFAGYAYNIAFISLFIWLWTIQNRKATY
ncbi:hypothetical protein MENTO_v1c04650 [Mesoplasma entomophilum]|uniref:Uncharacterized protein n=1 Tax=Mesoplasma entomophilum TaxID=2149 RepID=A0A3S5Y0G6_9MOLU|nr:hypothetical protein [Mesoplasma entomophilum]ATQ35601.1 hypothetical protein CS528_02410 [Mesoplasma entomophilum]ATZ19570.1 hypothetical protein MENTO_v1c04650 [Mesoplasma entomophilum]